MDQASQRTVLKPSPPPPPPPPPPPTKPKPIANKRIPPSKRTSGGWRLVAGALLGAGAAYALKLVVDENSSEGEVPKDDVVRQYLRVQAEQHADSEAKAVLAKDRAVSAEPQQEFRLDVSRKGLATTLNFLLETKRMEEDGLIKQVRRGVYPANYEKELRRMKKEKKEMKGLIKRLKPA